jgi:hypothetical protein
MATSLYFNNFSSSGEQRLIEDLVIESIKIYGVDNYYVPRKIVNYNNTFREQNFTEYGTAVSVEMYVRNVDGFDGEGEFLSAFGVEVREQITFSMALRTFETEVGAVLSRDRPLEGDLIFFPFTKALYAIKFVNKKPVFYQMGSLQFYDIVCELFEYSNEVFNTGVDLIDQTYNAFLTTTEPYYMQTESGTTVTDENGDPIVSESYDIDKLDTTSQNNLFETEGLDFLDFTERDPFSEFERRA